jgi:hypothetical protein
MFAFRHESFPFVLEDVTLASGKPWWPGSSFVDDARSLSGRLPAGLCLPPRQLGKSSRGVTANVRNVAFTQKPSAAAPSFRSGRQRVFSWSVVVIEHLV